MAASFVETYASAVSQQLDFLPTWPLDYDVKLGDVGVLKGNIFRRTDTLEHLGLGGFKVRNGRGDVTLEFTSKDGVEMAISGGADSTLKETGAEVEVTFSREGAVFLRVGDHSIQQIESTDALGREIIERFKRGEWERDRVVVTEVVRASAATVLVSGCGKAGVSFKLDAGLPAQLALAKGKLSLQSLTGSFTAKVIGEEVSPLLRTCGLRRKLFGIDFRAGKSIAGRNAIETAESLEFGRVDSFDQAEE